MTDTSIQTAYDELKEAIIAALPANETKMCSCLHPESCEHRTYMASIGLEDVLRASHAIGRPAHWDNPSPRLNVDSTGLLFFFEYRETPEKQPNVEWHLGQDLAWHRDNAPETIHYLHGLLVDPARS